MQNSLEWRVGDDGFVEGAGLGNVLDDGEVELVSADVWVGGLDLVCLLLRADGGDDGVTALEERVENVGCNEAAATFEVISLRPSLFYFLDSLPVRRTRVIVVVVKLRVCGCYY